MQHTFSSLRFQSICLIILFILINWNTTTAQAPQKMSYQSVVRDAGGALVTNSTVGIQISIVRDSVNGTAIYEETHTPTTNTNGLATLEIGTGTVVSGMFDTIDWSEGPYFLKSETDPEGGTNYTVSSTSQLMSVPYALYAGRSGDTTSLDQAYDSGGNGHGRMITADSGAVRIEGTDGFQVTGMFDTGDTIDDFSGAGTRMFFNPRKAAFRAGYIDGDQWNEGNAGDYSTALGRNTEASGDESTAMGSSTLASGDESTAMGFNTVASGPLSTAMGFNTLASGDESTAMGDGSLASGPLSTAMGRFTVASGFASTAMGSSTLASGDESTAMGFNTEASGNESTAIGSFASTNGKVGSFVIGDHSTPSVNLISDKSNQFKARFDNGYSLFTSSDTSTGVFLENGDNAWSMISDRNRKENFLPVDGEQILGKIGEMELTTWNFKGQDPASQRHYGPMAQDFYKAFGRDALGTIGSDTRINTGDFMGVNLIGIRALERRTDRLEEENKRLKSETKALEQRVETLETEMEKIKNVLNENARRL